MWHILLLLGSISRGGACVDVYRKCIWLMGVELAQTKMLMSVVVEIREGEVVDASPRAERRRLW